MRLGDRGYFKGDGKALELGYILMYRLNRKGFKTIVRSEPLSRIACASIACLPYL